MSLRLCAAILAGNGKGRFNASVHGCVTVMAWYDWRVSRIISLVRGISAVNKTKGPVGNFLPVSHRCMADQEMLIYMNRATQLRNVQLIVLVNNDSRGSAVIRSIDSLGTAR